MIPRPAAESGVALIVVLWALALVSFAMLGLAAILQRQLEQEVASLQNARAMLVAESGVQMCLQPGLSPAMAAEASRLLSDELGKSWGQTPVRFEVGNEDLRGEDGKMNLNALALGEREFCRRVLTNLLGAWDVSPTTSSAFIDGLLDYVDADKETTGNNDATEENAKNAPLERLEEVERIAGWSQVREEAREGGWRRKFTIYGSGKLSLRNADQDVIEAWLELSPGAAANFMRTRLGPDLLDGTQDDVVNPGLLRSLNEADLVRINVGSEDLWRVTSTGYVGEVKRTIVALISRNPPQIKARWMEEKEGP